jgi:hypothetical protein
MTSGCSEAGVEVRPLAHRLLTPARRLDLAALTAAWFTSCVELRCRDVAGLARDPAVPGKLRGALGAALAMTASTEARAGHPCPWQPPCALDVLFRRQGRITPGLELPKPYVLALFPDGADLVLRLTLFGLATDWTEMVAEALVRALRGPLSLGASLAIVDRRYWSEEGVGVPEARSALIMAFATPLQLRPRRRAADEAGAGEGGFVSLMMSLGNRLSGLARWHDALLEADWQALKAQAAGLEVRPLTRVPVGWQRYSRRQRRWIPAAGVETVLLVQGELDPAGPLLHLLVLGESAHVGSHATLGQGRYELLVPTR